MLSTRKCQKFLQLNIVFCKCLILIFAFSTVVIQDASGETFDKMADEFIKSIKQANQNEIKILWNRENAAVQRIVDSAVTDFLLGQTQVQKQLCELVGSPTEIRIFTGVTRKTSEVIFKDCHQRNSNICDNYGCYGVAGSGRDYAFIFADKNNGYDSFTVEFTTFIVITPGTTVEDLKRRIFHELAVSFDFKNDQYYEFVTYADAEFSNSYPQFRKGIWPISEAYKNDEQWKIRESAMIDAFMAYSHSFVQQAFSAIRAYAVEDILVNKKDQATRISHEQCVAQVKEVLDSILKGQEIYFFNKKINSRFEDQDDPHTTLKLVTNPNAKMLYSKGKENLTFCQFMTIPQFHPFGRGVFNIGPRPTIKPGGWVDVAAGNVVEVSLSPLTRKDGNSSSNQKSSHDSASSQAIRGNENILVNEMFKNELSPSVGNGSGGFVGGSGGLE